MFLDFKGRKYFNSHMSDLNKTKGDVFPFK